ncbi:MAG: hypothetical protein U7123_12135 [Potamolinea sp.]
MSETPSQDFSEDEDFDEAFSRFLESIGSFPLEQMPEVMATITITYLKGNFEQALDMVKQSVQNLETEPRILADWRSAVQVKLREIPENELDINESQKQQFERV